ncbi:hypothetical protein K3495_g12991 [Podosphaera aphanis]|nr:hypothetical protein K3495_g12991 [Podosphaera aphanis]
MTPYEAQSRAVSPGKSNHKPDLSNIRVVGCRVLVYIPSEGRVNTEKLNPRAEEGILVGFEGQHIYSYSSPPIQVEADEPAAQQDYSLPERCLFPVQSTLDNTVVPILNARNQMPHEDDPFYQSFPEEPKRGRGRPLRSKNEPKDTIDLDIVDLSRNQHNGRMSRSKTKGSVSQHIPLENNPTSALFLHAYFSALKSEGNPSTFRSAINSPEAPFWKQSMEEELSALSDNSTWIVIPRSELPHGRKLISGRWIYKNKRGKDGQLTRYKSRYVAKGFL